MTANPVLARAGALSGAVFAVGLFAASSARAPIPALVALVLFVPFLAYLVQVLVDAADGPSWLSATVFAAGLAGITLKIGSVAPEIALRRGVASDSPLHKALDNVGGGATLAALWPLGVCLAAVAALVLTSGGLPRWLGFGAAVTAVALAVNGCFLYTQFVPALLLFVAWTLAASVALFRRAGRPAVRPSSAYVTAAG